MYIDLVEVSREVILKLFMIIFGVLFSLVILRLIIWWIERNDKSSESGYSSETTE